MPDEDEATPDELAEAVVPEVLPAREPFRSMLRWLGLVEQAAGIALLVVILVLVLMQVVQRYLPGGGCAWTGEIARFAMVWATFVIAGYLLAHDRHIAIKVVDFVLPRACPWSRQAAGARRSSWSRASVMLYATYDFIAARPWPGHGRSRSPAGVHLHRRRLRLRVDRHSRAVLTILVRDLGRSSAPARRRRHEPRHSSSWRSSLLFLLRVPMAFAILGPCLAYLLAEGYSLGLAVRLVVGGINSWPLLAVPLFILVGIVATRTEIAVGSTTRRCSCSARSGRARLRQHRRQPRVLVDERRGPRRRGRHRLDRGRPHAEEGLPGRVLGRPQRELGAHQPDHAAEHPGGGVRVRGGRVDGRPVCRGGRARRSW